VIGIAGGGVRQPFIVNSLVFRCVRIDDIFDASFFRDWSKLPALTQMPDAVEIARIEANMMLRYFCCRLCAARDETKRQGRKRKADQGFSSYQLKRLSR